MRIVSIAGRLVVLVLVGGLAGCAQASDADREAEVVDVLRAFYAGIEAGDAEAVMQLVAPDALFIEAGMLETREQYETNHLPADIEFSTDIRGTPEIVRVAVDGDTAWIVASTRYEGTFDGFPLEFDGLQLMVLGRASGSWLVEAIHWSSQ
jgi:ketosteroid isomerase-like protein